MTSTWQMWIALPARRTMMFFVATILGYIILGSLANVHAQNDPVQKEIGKNLALAQGDDFPPEFDQARIRMVERWVKLELGFVRKLCDVTPEQEKQLAMFDAAWIKRQLVQPEQPIVGGIFQALGGAIAGLGRINVQPLSTRAQLEKRMRTEFKQILRDDQWTAYSKELDLREKFRKDTAIRGLIHLLDRDLALSDEQKTKITEVAANWTSYHNIQWQFYMDNDQPYLPSHELANIGQFLTEKQRSIYASLQHVQAIRDDFEINNWHDILAMSEPAVEPPVSEIKVDQQR